MVDKYPVQYHMVSSAVLQQEYIIASSVMMRNCQHCGKLNVWSLPQMPVPREVTRMIRHLHHPDMIFTIWRRAENGVGAEFLLMQTPTDPKDDFLLCVAAAWGDHIEDITQTIRRCRMRYEIETVARHTNIIGRIIIRIRQALAHLNKRVRHLA
ncbi:MAG: hypothetical protein A3J58_03665 [Candidatus Sungbacteria bacterium RIFCSPHIGHO2_02_FULL_52_23]|uniref:Uncharacterized protein n=1 Tax=Candidatus Sungbacteria bacterium RIFCSPHIGHO2_02_FULL_52_23 TaxID=1802274 RepID=A0A1G2KSG1_9BACT|nr:MAG: hypothetical protein A3J58_03665 [Candidatus Sungbacteria bacterium RIFCSPHIGHO2_02_FULL_52_23]